MPSPRRRTPSRDRFRSATPLQLQPFSWPEKFLVRQVFSKHWENSPLIQSYPNLKYLGSSSDDELTFPLRTEDNWAADEIRVEAIDNLVEGATIGKLLGRDDSIPETKTALLIDGNITNDKPQLRTFVGGLSASELMKELMKNVTNDIR